MIAVGDFDGDGKADIALFCNYSRQQQLPRRDLSHQGPAGQHPNDVCSHTNWGPSSKLLAAGDLNRHGWIDLASTTATRRGRVESQYFPQARPGAETGRSVLKQGGQNHRGVGVR